MSDESSQSVVAQPTTAKPAAATKPAATSKPVATPKSVAAPTSMGHPANPIQPKQDMAPPGPVIRNPDSPDAKTISPTESTNGRHAVESVGDERSAGAGQTKPNARAFRINGSFDVMGGIAEYCGALTLSAKAADVVQVEVTLRQDVRVAIRVSSHSGTFNSNSLGGHKQIAGNGDGTGAPLAAATDVMGDWPLGIFYGDREGELASTEAVIESSRSGGGETLGLALAVLRAMLVAKVVPHFGGGLSIQIDSKLLGDRTRQHASLASCLFQAVSKTYSVDIPASRTAAILHEAFHEFGAHENFGGAPCGLATVASPMIDKPGHLTPICCRPLEIGELVAMPAGVTLMGIDSGIVYPNAAKKYQHARTTSMMGTAIIARLLAAANPTQDEWNGSLARITVSEYVERFRDRLPTKIKGQQFLERFGSLPDRTATIDAKDTYKIRSRTEHHIYENERVRRFVERLSRANRTGDDAAIIVAGELMYASHWSYGQRCGLGSRETDTLVNLLRGCGPGAGVFGARISGAGAGGTVVVLLRDSDETRSVIAGAVKQYEQETGLKTVVQPAAPLHT